MALKARFPTLQRLSFPSNEALLACLFDHYAEASLSEMPQDAMEQPCTQVRSEAFFVCLALLGCLYTDF